MAGIRTFGFEKSGGQVTFDREPDAILKTLRNGRYTVTIDKEQDPRTISQNSLMWLWFTCIGRDLKESKEYVHDVYCTKFLRVVGEWNGEFTTVVRHTRSLTKEEMTEFLTRVHADAAEMGIILPLPEDKFFEQFYQEFSI